MAFEKGETYPSSEGLSQQERELILGHKGCVVWLTGLSASGKTTIAQALESCLIGKGIPAFVLDGDSVRRGLCKDLGFSETDRHENIRRVGEVAALMAQAGVVAIAAFISPFKADRDAARSTAGDGRFVEVFLNTSLAVCEGRDPKNLYKRARAGQIPFFTGISSPYEPPESCEVTLNTAETTVEDCVMVIEAYLRHIGIFLLASPLTVTEQK